MQSILGFILVFGILVVVHEFGHYYAAKKSGVLVREFAVGFGPKIFANKSGETTYTARALPLGGYVRLAGKDELDELPIGMQLSIQMDDEGRVTLINTDEDYQLENAIPFELVDYDLVDDLVISGRLAGQYDQVQTYPVDRQAILIEEDGTQLQIAPRDRQLQSAPVWQRLIINFAGPLMNFILGVVVFTLIAFINGGVAVNEPVIGEVMPDSPAQEAGLQEGDRVLAVEGEEMASWTDLVVTVQSNPGQELDFQIERSGQTEVVSLIPNSQTNEEGVEYGQMGVYQPVDRSFGGKLSAGFVQTWAIITGILGVLGSMFTQGFNVNNFGGPVAIFAATGQAVEAGIVPVLAFMAYLSVNLGLVNLLPVPALDGGKIVLNIIEGIRGKPVSEKVEVGITLVGVGLLFLLMIAVTWNDIRRFFFN